MAAVHLAEPPNSAKDKRGIHAKAIPNFVKYGSELLALCLVLVGHFLPFTKSIA